MPGADPETVTIGVADEADVLGATIYPDHETYLVGGGGGWFFKSPTQN